MAQSQQQFNSDEVKNNFTALFLSNDKNVREKANHYLMDLQFSSAGWNIAQELITNPQNSQGNLNAGQLQQIQFLGSQILYQKTLSEFAKINDEQIQQIKTFVFNLLQGDSNLSLACNRQLCSCIGVIGLVAIASSWQTMIDDIIEFMKQGQKQLFLGLEILEGFASNLNNMNIGQQQLKGIRQAARAKKDRIYEIFNSLINSNTQQDTLMKAMECLNSWVEQGFKFQAFEDQNIIKNVALCFYSKLQDEEFLSLGRNFFETVFSNSDHANLLTIQKLAPDEQYSEMELQNLNIIIQMLQNMRNDFQKCMGDKELNPEFCKVYTDILVSFCHNFNTYLVSQNQISIDLLQMLNETVQHKSLKISLISLDFWCSLRSRVYQQLKLPQYAYLAESYKVLLTSILQQSKYRKLEHKQHEDDEKYFYEDVSMKDYRSTASDVILQCLSALNAQYGEQGLKFFQDLLFQLFNNTEHADYLLNLEVGLFATTSVQDDNAYFDQSSDFILQVFQFISGPQFPTEYVVVTQAIALIDAGCLQIQYNQQIADGVIKFIMKNMEIEQNRGVAASAFLSVANAIEPHDLLDSFKFMIESFSKQLDIFDQQSSIENLVTGIFNFGLKLKQEEFKQEAIGMLFQVVENKIQQFIQLTQNNQQTEQQFMNVLNILVSIFKGFDVYDMKSINLVKKQVIDFLHKNILYINALYEKFGNVDISKFVQVYKGIIKRSKFNLPESFVAFLTQSIKFLQENPKKNFECLQILVSLFENLKDQDMNSVSNQAFNNWLIGNFEQFNTFIIALIKQSLDTDLIREWVNVLTQSALYSSDLVTGQNNFVEIFTLFAEILRNIVEFQLNRQQMIFLMSYFRNPNINKSDKFRSILPGLIKAIFHALPNLSKTLNHQISIAFVSLCSNFKENQGDIQQLLYESIHQDVYSLKSIRLDETEENVQLYNKYRTLFAQGLVEFGVEGNLQKVRLSLGDFYDLYNKMKDLKDTYVCLNFKMGKEKEIIL